MGEPTLAGLRRAAPRLHPCWSSILILILTLLAARVWRGVLAASTCQCSMLAQPGSTGLLILLFALHCRAWILACLKSVTAVSATVLRSCLWLDIAVTLRLESEPLPQSLACAGLLQCWLQEGQATRASISEQPLTVSASQPTSPTSSPPADCSVCGWQQAEAHADICKKKNPYVLHLYASAYIA